jgi:hypothetical protein
MINLDREFRAGTLELFAPPGKPGPTSSVTWVRWRIYRAVMREVNQDGR